MLTFPFQAALHGADEKALNMTHGAVGLMFLDQKVHIISIVMPVREDVHEIRLDPIHLGGMYVSSRQKLQQVTNTT